MIGQSTSGTAKETSLPGFSIMYKDTVITHNHPTVIKGIKQATSIGSSLSGPDLRTAVGYNAAEIRAVSGQYTYSLRRPKGGWGGINPNEVHDYYMKHYNKYANENFGHRDKVGRSTKESNDIFMTRHQRANTLSTHQAMKEVAKKFGLEYTRKRTK